MQKLDYRLSARVGGICRPIQMWVVHNTLYMTVDGCRLVLTVKQSVTNATESYAP